MRPSWLLGLTLAVAGGAWFLFLAYAVSTRSNEGASSLVRLGIPVVLLSALVSGAMVGVGLWLAGRRR